ncbi:SMI1/KNR4 family protein [Myroides pelagicus]|uniref:SMI1/KNR4 family protein n=1 Tax=Myroides pelagicus TaxID=270914 RepID=A0A7K1GSR9_9FLAO|nr:SMI1/KNR4 family protein [Myroides pelagicus]MEC4113411.1 SMI1/KNR4 family protein [Myroides pelagicus]MTH31033.1 hypothetical protein [Myroides pelagicus]
MKRPKTVPIEAVYDREEQQWVLGQNNALGQPIGEWKCWAGEGYLSSNTFFSEEGELIRCDRFHPNGALAQQMSLDEQGEHQVTYYKAAVDTDEYFPHSPFVNAHKAVKQNNSSPSAYLFYDESDSQLSVFGDNQQEMTSLLKAKEGETAKQAVERLDCFIDLLMENENLDEDYVDEIDSGFRPVELEEVSAERLAQYEQDLGIEFPPSYKSFVLEKGFIQFGQYNEFNRRLFDEYSRLSDALGYWNIDSAIEFDQTTKEKLDNIITFSYGDEGLQLQWFHCFDYNTLNPDTAEVDIIDFDQDDCHNPLASCSEQMCVGRGFDNHISRIVDMEISLILDQ